MALTNKVAFCLLSDLKSDLGISDAGSDAALERRILAASALIERYCNRPFRRESGRVEKLAGFGTVRLLPVLTPIISVTSVTFEGATVDPTNYEIETDPVRNEGFALYADSGWYWSAPGMVSTAEALNPLPGQERRSFTVTYSGGYGLPNDSPAASDPQIPSEISEACLMLSGHLWRQKGRDGNVVGETVGEASVQFGALGQKAPSDTGGIPPAIAAMLGAFRRVI